MAKRGARKQKVKPQIALAPTQEQMLQSEYAETVSPEGKRFVRVAPIDSLRKRGTITEEQHKALSRFRDLWIACERPSPKSCLDMSPKGNGNGGPLPRKLAMQSELQELECCLDGLAHITRKVAGEDWSLSQWAIHISGCKGSGEPVCLPKTNALNNAIVDIRFAANRLIARLA